MARNVEIKARVESPDSSRRAAERIAEAGPVDIVQDDTFFRCDSGRLKLRMFSSTEGELIFYRRENQRGPKESYYLRSPTSAPETLRDLLTAAYGQAGRVKKQRTLFLVGRTRVHLDVVEGLGHFLELEVALDDNESVESGVAEANRIMILLGVRQNQLIEGAYVDLIAATSSERIEHDRTS
jgi:predicted adenylyl cyclase CyaB